MHKVTKYMQKPCSLFNKCICVANYAQTVLKTSLVSDILAKKSVQCNLKRIKCVNCVRIHCALKLYLSLTAFL